MLTTCLCVCGGELALTWDKIYLERGVVRVEEAYDRERLKPSRSRPATVARAGTRSSRRCCPS